ncbi:pyruvate kinase [Synechococcus sp. AH-551-E05]|nr:pyruvate kinase [Synechococcus sp. AH-551-E05]MDB4650968.1 pyruvate kinase [Synechococcus sp. AH-551-E05]
MTSIIGTVGPSSINGPTLNKLKELGLDGFRLNLSHLNPKSLEYYYEILKINNIIPSLDTQGAQVRVIDLPDKTVFKLDERLSLGSPVGSQLSNFDRSYDVGINHAEFFDSVIPGDQLKIGFDGLLAVIEEVDSESKICVLRIISPGSIVLNRALDVAGKSMILEPFTNFDLKAIKNSFEHDVEAIYVSFCESGSTLKRLNNLLAEAGFSLKKPKIIAKIENKKGVINLPEIAALADGILIDRGDLSREIQISFLPSVVASIIRTCRNFDTPCYVATNILDSMMDGSLPSRAEISDIHNLLSQGVSGFVLAAEMAIGNQPIESVMVLKLMAKVYQLEQRGLASHFSIEELNQHLSPRLKAWL